VDYQPGACNIGPAEIARRRRAGHVGVAMTAGLAAALAVLRAPPATFLLLAAPAATAASGYLQERLRFCAGFGARGVFNFGDLGPTSQVADADARSVDRKRSIQIAAASAAIGTTVGVVGFLVAR
jgi:hypothetical protein